MNRSPILLLLCGFLLLASCSSVKQDIEAVNARNIAISQEPRGDYYIGRRYHVPATRFWGYLRKPGESWRNAQLVIMDESVKLTPDRSPEYGPGSRYSKDNNYEYRIYGKYTGTYAYEPNSNQRLAVFRLTGYEVIDRQPGWLFKPSEKYSKTSVSLRPAIMP